MEDAHTGFGLTRNERELMELADEMASSMVNMNSQTYDSFILAREKFRSKLKRMSDEMKRGEERLAKIKETVSSI